MIRRDTRTNIMIHTDKRTNTKIGLKSVLTVMQLKVSFKISKHL